MKWYVIYCRARWEKKVERLLTENGINAWCPLNRTFRKWSDRLKLVEVPLFTSYVFVRITEAEKPKVRETPGVVNFVMHEGKPAVVRDKEIERIQRFLDEYDDVEAIHHIEKNQRVTVQKGLFVEKEGRVIDFQNSKVKVVIDSLGYTLVALFDKSKLTSK